MGGMQKMPLSYTTGFAPLDAALPTPAKDPGQEEITQQLNAMHGAKNEKDYKRMRELLNASKGKAWEGETQNIFNQNSFEVEQYEAKVQKSAVDEATRARDEARARQRQMQAGRTGRSGTILTGPQGITAPVAPPSTSLGTGKVRLG